MRITATSRQLSRKASQPRSPTPLSLRVSRRPTWRTYLQVINTHPELTAALTTASSQVKCRRKLPGSCTQRVISPPPLVKPHNKRGPRARRRARSRKPREAHASARGSGSHPETRASASTVPRAAGVTSPAKRNACGSSTADLRRTRTRPRGTRSQGSCSPCPPLPCPRVGPPRSPRRSYVRESGTDPGGGIASFASSPGGAFAPRCRSCLPKHCQYLPRPGYPRRPRPPAR